MSSRTKVKQIDVLFCLALFAVTKGNNHTSKLQQLKANLSTLAF